MVKQTCKSIAWNTQSVQFSRSVVSDTLQPWTAAHQASLSITNFWSLLKLTSIESVVPSNHLILCHPLLLPPSIFPRVRVFSNESVLRIRWPEYWRFSFASVLPMNIQGWFPLGLSALISFQSKGLSRVFSSITVWSISSLLLCLLYGPTLTSVHDYSNDHSFEYTDNIFQN